MFSSSFFNQNISSWNIASVESFEGFMNGKNTTTLSSANLDAIYQNWSLQNVKPNITISFGTAKHTSSSSSSKAVLTNTPNLWSITDGGI